MTTNDLVMLLTSNATSSSVLSHAVGIISAAKSGDLSSLASRVIDLVRAATPAAAPAMSAPAAMDSPVATPVVAAVVTQAPADTVFVATAAVSPAKPGEASATGSA